MTAHCSPPLFRFALLAAYLAFLWSVSPVVFAEYQGPVFPDERDTATRLSAPLPLPNPVSQRPASSKQVVFDELDPVGPVTHGMLQEDEIDIQPTMTFRQNHTARASRIIDEGNMMFMEDSAASLHGGMWLPTMEMGGSCSDEYPVETVGCFSGPIPITFGMGLFDNLSLFSETTTFKTALNEGGSLGFAQGINWSMPVTPQGTVTAQYGARTVQGDLFAPSVRHQTFLTAGLFKRLAFSPMQGGVAVDWLHDHSRFGTVKVRQMRYELAARTASHLEFGFTGAVDVFRDRPTTPRIDTLAKGRGLSDIGGMVNVHDNYTFFVRKILNSGGQVELRCGATERGDFIMGVLGEAALSDRLAVNGGISMFTPSGGGKSDRSHYQESWSMSLGVVLYFRGGAMSRQANLYRPMFDIAGNNSFFPRLVGRR